MMTLKILMGSLTGGKHSETKFKKNTSVSKIVIENETRSPEDSGKRKARILMNPKHGIGKNMFKITKPGFLLN